MIYIMPFQRLFNNVLKKLIFAVLSKKLSISEYKKVERSDFRRLIGHKDIFISRYKIFQLYWKSACLWGILNFTVFDHDWLYVLPIESFHWCKVCVTNSFCKIKKKKLGLTSHYKMVKSRQNMSFEHHIPIYFWTLKVIER